MLQKYKTILDRERRLEYTNASIFGGFTAFLEDQCQQALAVESDSGARKLWERVRALARGYLGRPLSRREEVLRELESLLDRLAEKHPSLTHPGPVAHKPTPIRKEPRAAKTSPKKPETAKSRAVEKPPAARPEGLDTPVKYLKGVGPQRSRLLERLGITTIHDLVYYLPRGYEDRSLIPSLSQVEPREGMQTVIGRIGEMKENAPRRKVRVVRARLVDESGSMVAVWFNQPHLVRQLKPGDELIITGRVVDNFPYGYEIQVREFERAGDEPSPHSQRIVPIYPTTEGIPVKTLRQLIHTGLTAYEDRLTETIPEGIRERHKLIPLRQAMWGVHFPEELEQAEKSRQRLAFDELFFFQMGLGLVRRWRRQVKGVAQPARLETLKRFVASLPFELTAAQQRSIKEIIVDMSQPAPMNRLLQGDVGSGKTVVAAAALAHCAANGYQGAVMVPTEILAEQHHRTMSRLLSGLGIEVALLRGSQPKKAREGILQRLRSGEISVVVGTQALIQEGVDFKALGLVVIDEQHRFGVRQRALLQQKGSAPHLLVMTATPIPRTMALTFYGDMDLSVIDELPPGRMPVKTVCVYGKAREKMYRLVADEIRAGRQAYFVCPLVEESETLDVEAATRLADELQDSVFPDTRVGLLHGRMKSDQKERVMNAFREGELDILVSTTVVEVGVDVANATVMVVEDAGRFGLAQLHQLRGRIGRGSHQGYCLLTARSPSPEVRQRLAVLEATSDGFKVAEEDLKLRGPGEYLGIRQHGSVEWKIADLARDLAILEAARQEAQRVVGNDPELVEPDNQDLYREARARLKDLDFPTAGVFTTSEKR
ncbi:MAG: ATP-dependent DNA helicase RecG [Firmicutes bacterium]|nr:ATP-dependent DNA helicase RecG [Bacillota bacterium]